MATGTYSNSNKNKLGNYVSLTNHSGKYVFPSDGYLRYSCAATGQARVECTIYSSDESVTFTYGQFGNDTYSANNMFVKCGMKVGNISCVNSGALVFYPLV